MDVPAIPSGDVRSPPGRHRTRTSLESFSWNSGFRSVFDTICCSSGFVFVGFALSMGFPKERMGMIVSLASLAAIFQIASLPLVNLVRNKKRFVLAVALIEPVLLIITVLALPFLPAWARTGALAAAVFLAAVSMDLTRPQTDNWLASVIPARVRGRYLGWRLQAIDACAMLSFLAAGFIAERIDKTNTFGFGCLLAGGSLFGILAILKLRHVTTPDLRTTSRPGWRDIRETFKVRPFRNYLLGYGLYYLPFYLGMPYYQVFNLQILHMRESVIGLMLVGYLALRILAARFLSARLDRTGIRWMMLVSVPFWILFFLAYPLSTPDRVWPLILGWAIAGVLDGVGVVALGAALYSAVPHTPTRPVFFAIANLAGMASLGIGSFLAMRLIGALNGVSLQLGPLILGPFHCFYALCAMLMIPSIFFTRFFPGAPRALSKA